MSVILVGMPGCGKSTVGRFVARVLGWRFVDTDTEIERQLGCSIRTWFEQHGEASFRDVESRVLVELSAETGVVLATGGGAALRDANREALKRGPAKVVYLRATPEDLARRLRHDTQRPLLQGVDPLKKLRELYAVRDPLYREVAHYAVDSGRSTVSAIAHLLLMQLELSPAAAPEADRQLRHGDVG